MLIAGAPAAVEPALSPWASVGRACADLGARLSSPALIADPSRAVGEAEMDEAVRGALAEPGSLEVLVVDAAGVFAAAAAGAQGPSGAPGDGARGALRACLDFSWNVTRAVVNLGFLPAGRGGRIVYLAPVPGAGEHAGAAAAGLENLARTLSIEWARHAITLVAVVPGAGTSAGEVAALTAYLASPAGAYFSGCVLELWALSPTSRRRGRR